MRFLMTIFIICLICVLLPGTARTQWIKSNGPYGGYVTALAASGTNIYVGTYFDGPYFLSTDNGTTWTKPAVALPVIRDLVIVGTRLFAMTDGGEFVSTDNGMSWDLTDVPLWTCNIYPCWFERVSRIVKIGSNFFAGTSTGVYRSSNGGANWVAVNTGLIQTSVRAITASGTNLFALTDSIYRSTNYGNSWALSGFTVEGGISGLAAIDKSIFAATAPDIYRSTDNGTTWIALGSNITYPSSLAVSGPNLFAGSGDGIFLSTDYGESWTSVTDGAWWVYPNPAADVPLTVSDTHLFTGQWGPGVYRFSNNDGIWAHVGVLEVGANSLFKSGPNILAGGTSNYPFGHISYDDGANWMTPQAYYATCYAQSGINLYSGGMGVSFSTDHGSTWTGLPGGVEGEGLTALAAFGTKLFGSWHGGWPRYPSWVSVSTDSGKSWTDANTPFSSFSSMLQLGTKLFAGNNGGGVYLSTDNGNNWTQSSLGSPYNVLALATIGTNLFAGTDSGVFRTTDDGTTWLPMNVGLPDTTTGALAVFASTIVAGTSDGGVFVSQDRGMSWIPINENLHTTAITTLVFHNNYLFAGSSEGVWKRPAVQILPSTTHTLQAGWNLISLPVHPEDHATTSLYLGALSGAFEYSGSYRQSDTLAVGKGYWLKMGAVTEVVLLGEPIHRETISVATKWNMIGSLSAPVLVSSILSEPAGMIASPFYGYNGEYYTSDSIIPGRGYWVKVNQGGNLILSAGPGLAKTSASNRIKIVATSELPPPPPGGEITNLKPQIPNQFGLAQNYPNPFNPVTTIRFEVPVLGFVTLKMYNVLGQEVATLVDGVEEPGYKSVQWDAAGMPSGVYFCRMRACQIDGGQAGSFVEVRKMILLR